MYFGRLIFALWTAGAAFVIWGVMSALNIMPEFSQGGLFILLLISIVVVLIGYAVRAAVRPSRE